MKKFKNYPRKYEFVFSGDEILEKKCKIDNVSSFENNPSSIDKYICLLKTNMSKMEQDYFSNLVKVAWLFDRFKYCGHRRIMKLTFPNVGGNGTKIEMAFGTFIRNYIGFDNRFFLGSHMPARVIMSYFEDFFPNYYIGDPFKEKYEYPFKYMNLGCLYLVYRMDERMDLLKYGEEHKMNYATFTDYVLNYTKCYNEEHGEKYVFTFATNASGSPVIINKKYEESKTCYFSRRRSKPLQRKQLRTKSITKGSVKRDNRR